MSHGYKDGLCKPTDMMGMKQSAPGLTKVGLNQHTSGSGKIKPMSGAAMMPAGGRPKLMDTLKTTKGSTCGYNK